MDWIEVAVPSHSGEIDELCLHLEALGVEGLCIEDEADFRDFLEHNRKYWDYVDADLDAHYTGLSRVKFYLPEDADGRAQLARIRAALDRPLETATLADQDWANSWRDAYEPLPIGKRLLVVPEWLDPDPAGRVPLRLDPGIAFGTGSHATTRMCLEALETLAGPGKTALDLGCGSGILSIAALLLGCDRAVGCDIDPKSPAAAERNAALNGIGPDRLRVCAGDVLSDAGMRRSLGGGYDLVLANIVADVIIPLSGFAAEFLAEGGAFLCSGIIDDRAAEVLDALRRNGFRVQRHLRQEEWHCCVCTLA